jgi:hypothetical protein
MADKVSPQSLSDLITGGSPKAEAPADGQTVLKNIRAKYPQYSDMSDQALASAVVKKYPTYRDALGDIASPPNLLQRGYRAAKDVVAKAGQYTPIDALRALASTASGGAVSPPKPLVSNEQAEKYSEYVTPILLTAPLTAGGGAAGSVAARGAGMLPRLLPAAGRVAGSSAGGGLMAAGEGTSIPKGVGYGALGGAVGEGVAAGLGKAGQAFTPAIRRKEAARIGQEVGRAAGLPSLTEQQLYDFARTPEGKKILDAAFSQGKEGVGRRLSTPIAGVGRATEKLRVPELSSKPLSLDEALKELQNVGKGIGQAQGLARSTGQAAAAQEYGEARAALLKAVAQRDPQAATLLDKTLADYSKGRAYLKLISQSLDENGRLDTGKLMRLVNEQAEKLSNRFGPAWPGVRQSLTRGQGLPARIDRPLRSPTSLRGLASWLPGGTRYHAGPGYLAPGTLSPQARALIDAVYGSSPIATAGTLLGADWLRRRLPGGHSGFPTDILEGMAEGG